MSVTRGNKNIAFIVLLIFLSGTFLMACNDSKKGSTNEGKQQKELTDINKKGEMPDVIFEGEEGKEISLKSLEGKVVFINFWATWCPPCRKELPTIKKLKKSFDGNDQIVFLMVDVDRKLKESSQFMKENNYDLPVYIAKSDIPTDFLSNAIPTTVILNKKGQIAARTEGAGDYSKPEVISALQKLINE